MLCEYVCVHAEYLLCYIYRYCCFHGLVLHLNVAAALIISQYTTLVRAFCCIKLKPKPTKKNHFPHSLQLHIHKPFSEWVYVAKVMISPCPSITASLHEASYLSSECLATVLKKLSASLKNNTNQRSPSAIILAFRKMLKVNYVKTINGGFINKVLLRNCSCSETVKIMMINLKRPVSCWKLSVL